MGYNIAGDIDVPGKKKPTGLAPGDPGYDAAAAAGPPALVPAPAPSIARAPTLTINPTGTQLSQEGVLRPAEGPFSAANPQPTTDGLGRLNPATPTLTRPVAGAAPVANLTNPAARAVSAITAAAPTIATAVAPAIAPTIATAYVPPASPAVVPQATSDSGRALGYGLKINGVNTFSDGTGGPGAPPATLTPKDLTAIAQGRGLSRADAGIGGGIGSAAFNGGGGLAGTPEAGAFSGGLTRPTPNAYAQAGADNSRALRAAQSDAASIATRDSRSVLGNAARTAAIDAGSSFGTPASRRTAYADALAGLNTAAGAGVAPASALGLEGVRDAGETTRAGISADTSTTNSAAGNRTELQKAILTRPTPTQVNLQDGTLGLLGQDGQVRSALDSSGKPVRPQIGKPQEDIASVNKLIETRTNALLGIDPLSGLIPAPDGKGKGRAPTAQEYKQADAAARATINTGANGPAGNAPAPTKQQFIAAARQHNPGVSDADLEKYYATTYGG